MQGDGWRISSWSQQHAAGRIVSTAGELPFAAQVAMVDDFTIGEPVVVTLAGTSPPYEVASIRPRDFRSLAPASDVTEHVATTTALTPTLHQLGVVSSALERLELVIAGEDYPHPSAPVFLTLRFTNVRHVQLPTCSDRFCRLVSLRLGAALQRPQLARIAARTAAASSDAELFVFEPYEFDEAPGFVIAKMLNV
ncbi:MAG TPA: hypothetical protein PLF40_30870 [Kofleriaceae bacterium]|nr:hypothetical protein [Kofleriaceae bacterium]